VFDLKMQQSVQILSGIEVVVIVACIIVLGQTIVIIIREKNVNHLAKICGIENTFLIVAFNVVAKERLVARKCK
jgi:hypothetical protein